MSYNIDTFKVKKLENLKIPLASFFIHPREDWHPKVTYGRSYMSEGREKVLQQEISINVAESCSIKGTLENEILSVTEIKWYGECSGTGMDWVLGPALKESTGELIASCVWEGGDSVNRLIVKDGNVTWEDIEL